MRFLLMILLPASALYAQPDPAPSLAGRWAGSAETVNANGVKRVMVQTIEFQGSGKDLTASQISRQGTPIPLKAVIDETGARITLLRELDFEGGEHIRWHLEWKEGVLTGNILCVHDAPKKWGEDWGGPLRFTRAAAPVPPQVNP